MKNQLMRCYKIPLVFCSVMLVLYACSKEPGCPDCPASPAKVKWLLTEVDISPYPAPNNADRQKHRFQYDQFNRLYIYKQFRSNPRNFPPPLPRLGRIDTFHYDNRQRITAIVSTDIGRGRSSHKKEFQYDAAGRRNTALKYMLDSNRHYVLSDSTVYLYQDNTIMKVRYHFGEVNSRTGARNPARLTGIDTAVFTYNQGNLVAVKAPWLSEEVQLENYQPDTNPYLLLGMDAIELEPYTTIEGTGVLSNWPEDLMITMQAPRFSKNNYGFFRMGIPSSPNKGKCRISYGSLDSMTAGISRNPPVGGYTIEHMFQYSPAN